jgi:hypothetical protein
VVERLECEMKTAELLERLRRFAVRRLSLSRCAGMLWLGLNLKEFSGEAADAAFAVGVNASGLSRIVRRLMLRFSGRRVELDARTFDANAEFALELHQVRALLTAEERGGDTASTSATGAANAVNEVLGDFGQVVIDDLRDVLHVDAARSDVSGNKDANATLLKTGERCVALRLRTIAVNHGNVEAIAIESPRKTVCSALGAREDQNASRFLTKQAHEHLHLFVGRNFEGLDADIFRRLRNGAEGNAHGRLHVIVNQMRDRSFESRGEAERLAFARKRGNDALDGWEKAHVEHAVGFIENQNAQIAEIDEPAREKILEAARRCHDQASTTAKRGELNVFRKSADDERGVTQAAVAKCVVSLDDLHGKFASRNENQRRDALRFFAEHVFDDGDQERERLARAGLRGGQNVFASESLRDCRSLNGRRSDKFILRQAVFHISRDRHGGEQRGGCGLRLSLRVGRLRLFL